MIIDTTPYQYKDALIVVYITKKIISLAEESSVSFRSYFSAYRA